ncbi:IS3 family transposase [Pseudoduganella albidiflava]|uniref:Integrase n=1 Tax=Pseudoduganella albidiflava TaxID=321983 RepID=A0AA87Y337_9BURK|nr:IS3 family transposase [Pseudoduganella albidiflava]GGY71143.1 integrase [Pseudoduganella albidiflava]
MKYAAIEELRNHFPVKALCRVLEISRSGFYAWRCRPPSRRSQEDLSLREKIRCLHESSHQALGAVKTWHQLNSDGVECGKHRVARLRKLEGIEALRKAKFRVMRAHQHTEPPAPNLLDRVFTVPLPNKAWVSDITTIHTREGWLHLAIVLDLFARRIVGWAMSPRQDATLPIAALQMAIVQRRPAPGLICHTDQGSVYGSKEYRNVLETNDLIPSMSRRGNCHDNAVAESFFSTVKNEKTRHIIFTTRAEAITQISDYIELYYNLRRPHQTLGYRSPIEIEKQHQMLN